MARKCQIILISTALILSAFFIGFKAWSQSAGTLTWTGNVFNGFWAPPALGTNNPPSVSITAPANGSTDIYPGTFTFTAQASDSDGTIARVDFYYNDFSYLGTDLSSPYSFEWQNIGLGTYAVKARAVDNIGNATYSEPINVTVNPNTPPVINITTPTANATIDGPLDLQITAQVTDSDDIISSLEFFQRTQGGINTLITGCSFAGLGVNNITKDCIWPAAGYSDAANYILTVVAIDDYGDTTTSETPITINNVNPVITITKIVAKSGGTVIKEVQGANLDGAYLPLNSDLDIFVTLNMPLPISPQDPLDITLYQGIAQIGQTQTNSSVKEYAITWPAVAEGNYSLTAKTTDIYNREKISAPVNIIVAREICNNSIDEDGDGNLDNGCVPIHFEIVGESGLCQTVGCSVTGDVYYASYRPHGQANYAYIISASDNNLGSVLNGQKVFDFKAMPGWYDFKIDFYSPYVYPTNYTQYYSNVNIAITGTSQSAVGINSVAASGQSYAGHDNNCALASPPAPNKYTCTLATPACTMLATSCGVPNPDHGRAEFSALVFSNADRKVFITAPADQATFGVFTDNITIQAYAYSPNTITKVEFYAKRSDLPRALLGTDTTSPFSFIWDVGTIHGRVYELTAKAYDSQGNFTSSPITITKN